MKNLTFHYYLLNRILSRFVIVFLALQAIALSHSMIQILENTLDKKYPYSAIAWVLSYSTLETLSVVVTFAAVLATVLVLGEKHNHRELNAAIFLGIDHKRFTKTILSFVVPLAVVMSIYTLVIMPQVNAYHVRILHAFKEAVNISTIGAGQFTQLGDSAYIFTEKYHPERNQLENIFFIKPDENLLTIARYGKQQEVQEKTRPIDLYEGYSYQGIPGQTQVTQIGFERYTINVSSVEPIDFKLGRETDSVLTLIQAGTLKDWSELQRRLSMPIVLIVTTLFILMVYLASWHQQRRNIHYVLLVLCVGFFLIYTNITVLLSKIITHGIVFLYLGWLLHLVLLVHAFAAIAGTFRNFSLHSLLSQRLKS